MTKYIEEAKVIGQWVLNAVTRELDMIAPKIAAEAVPGQFVNVQVSRRTAPLLRRPLGVAGVDRKRGVVRLVYRFVGEATNILGDVCNGDRLSVVGPLGHGFDRSAKHPLLVGGGTGQKPASGRMCSWVEERRTTCSGKICIRIWWNGWA